MNLKEMAPDDFCIAVCRTEGTHSYWAGNPHARVVPFLDLALMHGGRWTLYILYRAVLDIDVKQTCEDGFEPRFDELTEKLTAAGFSAAGA